MHFPSAQIGIEFQHAALESVMLPGTPDSYIHYGLLQGIQYLVAISSPTRSPTFGVLIPSPFTDSPEDHDPRPHAPSFARLPYILSDLCDVVVKRSIKLRAEAHHTWYNIGYPIDFSSEDREMRSQFQTLGRTLWNKVYNGHALSTASPQSFEDAIQPHLDRIDRTFRELHATHRIVPNLSSHSDGDVIAVTTAGVLPYYPINVGDQACLVQWITQGSRFRDLPIEIAQQVFNLLQPVYTGCGKHIPYGRINAKDYCAERFFFAQLMLVSKLWAYHPTIIISSRGTLVHTIIIDDVDLGPNYPDVHIRTHKPYIDKCLELSTGASRVEYHGEYTVEFRGHSTNHIRTLVLGRPVYRPPSLLPSAFSSAPPLEHLRIIGWQRQSHNHGLDSNIPKLPKCRTIELHKGDIARESVAALLSLASVDGKSTLEGLSILNVPTLQAIDILALLQTNAISSSLTTLRVQLGFRGDTKYSAINNDLPIQLLALCPLLVEFSYTSPSSLELFQHLPQPLRMLELAVLLPLVLEPTSKPPTLSSPSISSAQPFIDYLNLDRAPALKRLSIIRCLPCYYSDILSTDVRWLDSQSWDEGGELRAVCKTRSIQFDCTLSLGVEMDML